MVDNQSIQGKKRSLGYMHAQELQWKLKSKEDFIVYLDKHLQYYLPDESVINKDFLKDVLAGNKSLMKKSEVQRVTVPHYDELSVKNLWPNFNKDVEFLQYFPDKYPVGKGPPRQYFFDILNTVHPEYLEQIMKHANEQRMAANSLNAQTDSIQISKFWEEELKSMPYLSKKNGKTLHLLKQGSKKISSEKKRRKIEVLGSIDDFKKQKSKAMGIPQFKPGAASQQPPTIPQIGSQKPAGQPQISQLFMQPSQRSDLLKDTEMKKK